jgi:hypothetical protein
MSQYDDDDEFEFEDDGNINTIRKADRAKAKKIKDLESRLASFEAKERTRSLAKAISGKGLSPKIAAFVPADLDEAGLDSWLDEYGDVFAPSGSAAATEQIPAPAATVAPDGSVTFQEVAGTGMAPIADESQMLAQIEGVANLDELKKLLGM